MTSLVAIMGATATGKSGVAVRLAEDFGGEVVSMDSRQIYRGFDIGTAKPSPDDRRRVHHHLLDILDPGETHSAGRHIRMASEAIADISERRKLPLLAGGTGLYFRGFFLGLIDAHVPEEELGWIRRELEGKTTEELYDDLLRIDPARAKALSPSDRVRMSRAVEVYLSTGKTLTEHFAEQAKNQTSDDALGGGSLRIVLTFPRAALRERIARRTREMYRSGWVSEVRRLLNRGSTVASPAMNSLGYRTIAEAMVEGRDPKATVGEVITLTQQYAKRQETFFRSIPDAQWVDMSEEDAMERITSMVKERVGS